MKMGVYYNNNDVRVEETEIPSINDSEILLKVISSGICGSDVMEWYRIKKAPVVLGHEVSGIVAKAGKDVIDFKEGDRIFASHHVPCNTCIYCLRGNHTSCETLHKTTFYPGGFAEYVRIPEINVRFGTFRLPENISFDEGTFIEPLGCVLRGQRIAGVKSGDTVLIIGSGISGLMHIQAAKSAGASRIIATDITGFRLSSALKFGADYVLDARKDIIPLIKSANNGRLADVVIVCTGAMPAVNQALKCADKGGTILFFAVPRPDEEVIIPINDYWRNEIKIATSYGASPYDLKVSMEMISSGRIDVKGMITHKLKMEEIGNGFKLVADAKESIKVIIGMQ